jgi:hypothetical protein
VGGEGAVEFSEFGFEDLRNCRDIRVIVGGCWLRGALDWKLWMRWMLAGLAEPHSSTP